MYPLNFTYFTLHTPLKINRTSHIEGNKPKKSPLTTVNDIHKHFLFF
jgi:hypothetical protein